jgi:pimeloyl-CoA synthetase
MRHLKRVGLSIVFVAATLVMADSTDHTTGYLQQTIGFFTIVSALLSVATIFVALAHLIDKKL